MQAVVYEPVLTMSLRQKNTLKKEIRLTERLTFFFFIIKTNNSTVTYAKV